MTIKILFDTSLLENYRHSPNNYCHFIFYNLIELYTMLEAENLLHEKLEIYTNNPSDRFHRIYEIFGQYAGRQIGAEEPHFTFRANQTMFWKQANAETGYDRVKRFVEFVRDRVGGCEATNNVLTYVRRSPRLLGRFFVNEEAVVRTLNDVAAQNNLEFKAVKFEHETFASQIRLMSQTRMLIGLHGAAFANSIFCRPKTEIVQLWPHPGFRHARFERVSSQLDLSHSRINQNRLSAPNLLSILRLPIYYVRPNRQRIRRDRIIIANTCILRREVENLLADSP